MTKPDTLAMCLILASVLLGSVGQIVLKSGMEHAPQVTSGWALASAFRSPVVLAGLACYVMATLHGSLSCSACPSALPTR